MLDLILSLVSKLVPLFFFFFFFFKIMIMYLDSVVRIWCFLRHSEG